VVVGDVIEVDPLDPRAVSAVQRYADDLAATLGFPAGSVGSDGQQEYSRPDGAFLIVVRDGDVVGCAALRSLALPDGPAAEVKRMWVGTHARPAALHHSGIPTRPGLQRQPGRDGVVGARTAGDGPSVAQSHPDLIG
jgi:hypothetical protein